MNGTHREYRAMISSDWNECLAPCGPFDFISFAYPYLEPELSTIFREYSANKISLSEAIRRITARIPAPLAEKHMDSYLDECFETYRGVPELIEWCEKKDILFMINTTGMLGYFQRVFAKGLLPNMPVVSAHPMIQYHEQGRIPCQWYDILEIQDKPQNSQTVMIEWGIPPDRVVLIGDSGGDGPHFEWGTRVGAFLIAGMAKASLDQYCGERKININLYFGPHYSEGDKRNNEQEMDSNFMDLTSTIELIL